jgi:hypothetical protein
MTYEMPHKRCFKRLQAKAQWEHMSLLAVLKDWPSVVCARCAAIAAKPSHGAGLPEAK